MGNRLRAHTYAREADCPLPWFQLTDCEVSAAALGHSEYAYQNISEAPWWDPDIPDVSSRFFGFYTTAITNVSDSTWVGSYNEGIGPGGSNGPGRYAVREIRVRGFMAAQGEDALEHGMTWLVTMLEPGTCATHENSCGDVDMMFFASCPRDRGEEESMEDYDMYVRSLRRYSHDIRPLSGPLILQQVHRGQHYGYEVEFTLSAENPHIYGSLEWMDLLTSDASTVLSSPYNLVTHPSAELRGLRVEVSRNLVNNPSFEVNTDFWRVSASTISGSNPSSYVSLGRSTSLKAVGSYSGLFRLQGNGTTAATGVAVIKVVTGASSQVQDLIDLTAYSPGTSVSLTAWAACIASSVGSVDSLNLRINFFDEVGWITPGPEFPAGDPSGHTWQETFILPEATAFMQIVIKAQVTWTSSATSANNSDHRLYVDAVAVTVP